MNSKLLLLLLTGFYSSVGLAAYPDCPRSLSASELTQWREGVTQELSRVGANSSSVVSRIEGCFPTQIPACLKRAHAMAESQSIPYSAKVEDTPKIREMKRPPREFLAPGESGSLDEDTKFILFKGTPGQPDYKDVEQVAKEKGWPMVRYKSRHAGGFDSDTSALLMIRVPGAKMEPPVDYDRYVNIALPADDNEGLLPTAQVPPLPAKKIAGPEEIAQNKAPRVMTIVTVQHAKGASTPSRVYFTKYNRQGDTPYYLQEKTVNPSSCYSCHPNGIRSISPLGYHVRDEENARGQVLSTEWWKAARDMNNAMDKNNGYRAPVWEHFVDESGKKRPMVNPAAYGPEVGPTFPLNRKKVKDEATGQEKTVYPTREKEYIVGADGVSGCASSSKEIDVRDIFSRPAGRDNVYKWDPAQTVRWEKVKDAMNCATCHNNRIRGALNDKVKWNQIQFKILVDQSMPVTAHLNPGDQENAHASVIDHLNNNERIALTNCLQQEFEEEKKLMPQWLNQVACTSNETGVTLAPPPASVVGPALEAILPGAREANPASAVQPAAVSGQGEAPAANGAVPQPPLQAPTPSTRNASE